MYKSKGNSIQTITDSVKMNNQVVLTGSDALKLENGYFFLEFLHAAAAVNILDGEAVTVVTGIADFSNDHMPIRCDNGISFSDTIVMAKGFFIEGVRELAVTS